MNILITGAWKDGKTSIREIEKMGHHTIFMQHENEALPCKPEWIEGVICNGLFLYHDIKMFCNLRYIQLTSTGFDRVPLEYIQENQITIHNAKGVYSIPIAEFVLSSVLQIYKKSKFFYENQKKYRWEKERDLDELYGKVVCIVGCGDIGVECAKRFNAFGCCVYGINRTPKQSSFFYEISEFDRLNEVLQIADIVVVCLALTRETRYIFDAERLGLIKDGATFVNISRGEIVDTSALEEHRDRFEGIVLDVFEEEPLPSSHYLWTLENAIITPHNSYVSKKNDLRLKKMILEHIRSVEI